MLVRIASHQFHISEPFAEGHRLTAEEARALNAYRAESIVKNCKRRFDETLPDTKPSPEALAEFQSHLARYDADYVVGRLEKPGAITQEARRVAIARLPDSATRAEIEAFASRPEILEEARQRVTSRQAIIAAGIDDLIT